MTETRPKLIYKSRSVRKREIKAAWASGLRTARAIAKAIKLGESRTAELMRELDLHRERITDAIDRLGPSCNYNAVEISAQSGFTLGAIMTKLGQLGLPARGKRALAQGFLVPENRKAEYRALLKKHVLAREAAEMMGLLPRQKRQQNLVDRNVR